MPIFSQFSIICEHCTEYCGIINNVSWILWFYCGDDYSDEKDPEGDIFFKMSLKNGYLSRNSLLDNGCDMDKIFGRNYTFEYPKHLENFSLIGHHEVLEMLMKIWKSFDDESDTDSESDSDSDSAILRIGEEEALIKQLLTPYNNQIYYTAGDIAALCFKIGMYKHLAL